MESRSVAGGEKGVLIHFDPLLYAKQTPQIALPTKTAATSTREISNDGTGWALQHPNLHKVNYANSCEIILNVIFLINISNIHFNTHS